MTKINVLIIKKETREEFFSRGRDIAVSVDRGEFILSKRIISFEDENDMKNFLTQNKLIT